MLPEEFATVSMLPEGFRPHPPFIVPLVIITLKTVTVTMAVQFSFISF